MKKSNKVDNTLKINPKLPKIILPENKINMFVEWYNKDIRFQDSVPKSFQEGYLVIETGKTFDFDIHGIFAKNIIKTVALATKSTYREIENRLLYFRDSYKSVIVKFNFITDNHIFLCFYSSIDGTIISTTNFEVGKGGSCEPIDTNFNKNSWDEFQSDCGNFLTCIFITVMWYLATTTKTTKYYREEKYEKPINIKNKNIRPVTKVREITTPIYDISKIRNVKVDSLIRHRQGWTYSHSFEVHGHFRHYKNGKTIFINPYIKGKDKSFQQQDIIIKTKEI